MRHQLAIYAGSTPRGIAGVGGVKLSWDVTGIAVLTFNVKAGVTIDVWEELYAEYDGERCFHGRVRSVRRSDKDGMKVVTAQDWKGWLSEAPLINRSLQVSSTVRHARVKYAYTDANIAGGNLYWWTVGAMVQDMLNGAYAGLGGTPDTLPVLGDVLPTDVSAAMANDHTNWKNAFSSWIGAYQAGTPTGTSAWKDLTLKPWGHQFDGVSLLDAINQVMGRYYPSRGWWYDPAAGTMAPYATYDEAAVEYDVETKRKLYVDDIEPVLQGCFTRVIVEGQKVTKVTTTQPDYLPGFVCSDHPYQGAITMTWTGADGILVSTRVTATGFDSESYKVFKSSETFIQPIPGGTTYSGSQTEQGGYYGRDDRSRKDTGYGGTAYDEYGVKRTLVIVDDTVGERVYMTQDEDPDSGDHYVDRSAERDELANGIWSVLRDVRYQGKLSVPGTPLINPLQRVTILNHPDRGDVTFRPQSIEWDAHTGMLTYVLGDSKWNPRDEISLLQQIRWRDKLPTRAREPQVVRA